MSDERYSLKPGETIADHLRTDLAAARRERDRLRAIEDAARFLKEHGWHASDCPARFGHEKCPCGYEGLIAALEDEGNENN